MNATHTEPIPNPLQRQNGFTVPAALEAEVAELVTHYPEKRSASLMVLHAIQEQFGWISQEAVAGAHSNPAVLSLWKRFEAVCTYEIPANLAEFRNMFAHFEPV